jgi:hypothetical protein
MGFKIHRMDFGPEPDKPSTITLPDGQPSTIVANGVGDDTDDKLDMNGLEGR